MKMLSKLIHRVTSEGMAFTLNLKNSQNGDSTWKDASKMITTWGLQLVTS